MDAIIATLPLRPSAAENEQFVDIVCADDELLRAEFDAIIAAEWPAMPPPRPRLSSRPDSAPPPVPPVRLSAHRAPSVPGGLAHPGTSAWIRLRSPPTTTTANAGNRQDDGPAV